MCWVGDNVGPLMWTGRGAGGNEEAGKRVVKTTAAGWGICAVWSVCASRWSIISVCVSSLNIFERAFICQCGLVQFLQLLYCSLYNSYVYFTAYSSLNLVTKIQYSMSLMYANVMVPSVPSGFENVTRMSIQYLRLHSLAKQLKQKCWEASAVGVN